MIGFLAKWLPVPIEEPNTTDTTDAIDGIDVADGEMPAAEGVGIALRYALDELRKGKPNDRSEVDRAYAIAITDLQKVVAFFEMAVIQEDDGGLQSMYDRLDDVMSGAHGIEAV